MSSNKSRNLMYNKQQDVMKTMQMNGFNLIQSVNPMTTTAMGNGVLMRTIDRISNSRRWPNGDDSLIIDSILTLLTVIVFIAAMYFVKWQKMLGKPL